MLSRLRKPPEPETMAPSAPLRGVKGTPFSIPSTATGYNGFGSLLEKLSLLGEASVESRPLTVLQADISRLDSDALAQEWRQYPDLPVVLDMSTEAMQFETTDGYLSGKLLGLHRLLDAAPNPPRLLLLNANVASASAYLAWCRKHRLEPKLTMIGYHFYLGAFWADVTKHFAEHHLQGRLMDDALRVALGEKKRGHGFTCLNHRPRSHRVAILVHLMQKGWMEKGLVSFAGDEAGRVDAPTVAALEETKAFIRTLDGAEALLAELPNLLSRGAITLDRDPDDIRHTLWGKDTGGVFQPLGLNANGPDPRLHDSWMEIVTETWFTDESSAYLTEKTLRPMLLLKPFLHVGTPYALHHLRLLGFRTFSPWIDESYDDAADPALRMTLLFREIDRLCALSHTEWQRLYAECWPVLRHNFLHFLEQGRALAVTELEKRVFDRLA